MNDIPETASEPVPETPAEAATDPNALKVDQTIWGFMIDDVFIPVPKIPIINKYGADVSFPLQIKMWDGRERVILERPLMPIRLADD